jgi:regulatory protein
MLLSYRSRSEKELKERLGKKGFSDNPIAVTLKYLKQAGYLDDHALALDLKRQAFNNKLLGYNRAKIFLLDKGVPDDIVSETLTYDEETELQKIQKLMDRKLRTMGACIDDKKKKKLWDFLVRKGYSYNTIRNAFRNLTQVEGEE